MTKFIEKIKERSGEGYIDVILTILSGLIVIALAINLYPAYIVKDQLNTLAKQTLREAQLDGKVEVDYAPMAEVIGIEPDSVKWEAQSIGNNKVQFGEDILVTFTKEVDIGFLSLDHFQ